jgi:ABC-type sugar transport system ATPase subunit
VRNLTIAQKQLVCIARALYRNPRVLVLDEPTSRLSKTETEALFEVINKLKREQNITVIFVSHRMEEIFEISDRITILKDGKKVGTFEKNDITHDQVVEHMVGKDIFYNKEEIDFSTVKLDSTPLLEINNLEIDNMYGPVSFKVFPGEIFGITGAVGSKKTEIIETIFGLRKRDSGKIIINGKDVKNINPRKAISMNISLVPEDRRNSGIIYDFSVKNNSTLSYLKNYTKLHSFLDFKKEKKDSMKMIDRLSIKTTSEKKLLRYLSGGNQQKVVIAKWLLGKAKIYFFDEPTIGIDVKGKEEIYKIIRELSREGNAVVVASSDIDEILPLVHKTIVLFKGKQMKEFSTNDVDKKTLLYLTMGGSNNE